MAEPEPIVISDGTQSYKILRSIGTWGPDFTTTIYEAVILPERLNSIHVAVKLIDRTDSRNYYDIACDEIDKNQMLNFHPANDFIFITDKFFISPINNIPTLCIVLPFDAQVSSLRSLIVSNPRINGGGLPENCIPIPLERALHALSHLHFLGRPHRQVTAGNMFVFRQEFAIKLAYASSIYERTAPALAPSPENVPALAPAPPAAAANDQGDPSNNPETESFLEINSMLDWARAPEVEKSEMSRYRYTRVTYKSDIWLIGITALELAYGKIQVVNRDELLDITNYIHKNHELPNTWEELRMKSAAEKNRAKQRFNVNKVKNFVNRKFPKLPFKKKERKFSVSFADMVARCLAKDPAKRPKANELLEHDFICNYTKTGNYFYNVVVNFLAPP